MKTYHLFISHSWNHHDHYAALVNMPGQAQGFKYKNFSIPKNDPVHSGSDKELSEAIRCHMESCGIVLVLVGVYASYSKWIDKEIKIAKSAWTSPKSILAISPWGNQRISREATDSADKTVGWNTNSIVSAIRELA